jgi:hypothetical protein
VSAWLNLALGIVHLLTWIAQRLDAADRQRLITAVTENLLRHEIDDILDRLRRAGVSGVPDSPGPDDRNFRD